MPLNIKHAVKSFWSGLNTPIREATRDANGNFFYSFTGSRTTQNTLNVLGQAAAYKNCAPLSGIIQRKAKAFNNGKLFLMDANGKESTVSYAKSLMALMERPNVLQTWSQLMNQLYTYYNIFGEVFLFALYPIGFEDDVTKTKSLWIIPNWIMIVKETGKIFLQSDISEIIESYTITSGGSRVDLPKNSVLHIKDSILNTDFILRGQSRMVALQDPISNIIAAYEARNVLITRKGALGILSNNSKDAAGSIPLKESEKKDLQDDFKKYGLAKDQYQVIITSAALQWQSMTFSTKDLMLFEEIEDDVRQIADNYEYPMYLLGFKSGSTYSNVGEAKKSLYQDAIIPEAESIYLALSKFFNTEKYGFSFKVFYDHLEILQKSEKDKAEAFKIKAEGLKVLYELKTITREELRIAMDYDSTKFEGNTFYDGKPAATFTVQ